MSVAAAGKRHRVRWLWAAIGASLLGFLTGGWIVNDRGVDSMVDSSPLLQATMISSTGCVWGPGDESPAASRRSGGDSLQLLEGIAEFSVGPAGSGLRLQLEGPASMVLAAQGGASMSYGKIVVRAGRLPQPYPIETSFGRLLVEGDAEAGLTEFGRTAQVHCFRGQVTIESPWLRSNEPLARVELQAGESVRLSDVGGAEQQVRRGVARPGDFTPQLSMNSDFLSVSSAYVREIVAAGPVAYWRFEEAANGVFPNEMGASFQGRLTGQVRRTGPEGNRAIELGMDSNQGSVVATESWDDVLRDDFSVELWMKPSHHHLGSMVGFVGEFDPIQRRNKHGVLLETCGPSAPSDWLRMKQLRFLHRTELTTKPADGVSCFSGRPYDVRRWQHVAAVRRGGELQLYLDGELAQSVRDDSSTPVGLRLVIGQLYTETSERFFIGQLDEVAVYGRALRPAEVARHCELLRPVKPEAARPTSDEVTWSFQRQTRPQI